MPTLTPRRVRVTTSATPSATNCSAVAEEFKLVHIHTAKCSQCDKRNMDVMRRCPGCTFQICKPCFDVKQAKGQDLRHGNMSFGPTTPSTVPVRRMLFTTEGTSTPTPEPDTPVRRAVAVGSLETKHLHHQDIDSAKRGPAQQQQQTPSTGGASEKRKRNKRKAKPKDLKEDTTDDEFVLPIVESPTPASKRRKVLPSSPVSELSSLNSTPNRRVDTLGPSPTQATAAITTANISPSSSTDTESQAPAPRGRKGSTIHELLEQHHVKYKHHFLQRNPSVSSDPIFTSPVAAHARPPPSKLPAADQVREVVDILTAAAAAAAASAQPKPEVIDLGSGSDVDDDQHQHRRRQRQQHQHRDHFTASLHRGMKIRELIEGKTNALHQGFGSTALDPDQKAALMAATTEVGRKAVVGFWKCSGAGMVAGAKWTLDNGIVVLTAEQQDRLVGAVEAEGRRKMREFEEEG
ncbi:hypothetical protein BS50DRAFT_568112 [Corynespora cassiicola Philippines]|uniref:Uncharacterized protein n=1 Tax=Corynespora cassiicola Philippines TaxID=1448308 RepID=A0A2T2PD50_CORCC|nr:hypothetical protein BS50DRAFT_568112 [Corynespora cassiicola Philippines]